VRRDVGDVYVQPFYVALANWYGEPAGLCVNSPTCGAALAMEFNGDVYSCDHFVEPEYLLGNIAERPLSELVSSPKQLRFGQDKLDALPRYCLECDVRFACHGGCPKDRFITTPTDAVDAHGQTLGDEPGLNYLCAGYRAFYRHIDAPMKRMCELLREDRAPSEVVTEPS
jgi:uncharacterized protein